MKDDNICYLCGDTLVDVDELDEGICARCSDDVEEDIDKEEEE